MKISFFIGSMVSGGAERVISLLANEYAKNGWDVEIALMLKNEVNQKQFALDDRIKIVDLSTKEGDYKKNALRWIRMVRSYIKKEKPDCIVSFIGRINALVLTAAIGLDKPILVSERNDLRHDGRGKLMQWYCNQIYSRAAAIVYQTKYERECFDRKLDRKSYVIPNPVEVASNLKIKENDYEISTAGRLVEQKNHALLIDAIAFVKKKYPEVKCNIYGEGPLREKLENQVHTLGLTDNVFLPGNKTDVNKWVARSSIFVMASNYEGLSNALIEAMMLGKACISTSYPGADELIKNDENGLIVPCNDARALANAIIDLFDKRELRNKLATNAAINSTKYQKDNIIEEWKKVIDIIIA